MITVSIFLVVLVALYLYGTRTFDYWAKRNIKHDKPLPFLGTNGKTYLMQSSITQLAAEMYNKYPKEKVVGFYRGMKPELIIRDPELIKHIISTDFVHFYPRSINTHKSVIEPLMRNVFFADGDLWRLLRQRMTPAFTSGKLKAMFPLIVERAERLQERTLAAAAKGRTIDARDLMARYTTDFIGACGFGIDGDALKDENSAFRKLGVKIFTMTFRRAIIGIMKHAMPEITKHWKFLGTVEKPFIEIVTEILKQRNGKHSGRNDFIDQLLELKAKGAMMVDSIEDIAIDGTAAQARLEWDDELLAAQVFIFFAAGFETSSSATSFTLHQLALNPEVQRKVQENIDTVLAKHNNRLSYDAVKEMHYLEWTFREGMRMFPSLGFLIRGCARPYTIPGTAATIDEGVRVLIPVQALHNDPEYFDRPHEFRPERFHPDKFDANKYKYVYLPFGEGPRACIGERLGLMQSLAGLAAVLARFWVAPAPETLRDPVVEPKMGIVQTIRGGLPLLFRERSDFSTPLTNG
ncbi:cytochrome P450 6B6-like [Choristoneura fumiferana]|uniref:cytochrome P450 6B6-like n=1 Tax=Choristoneura fumiferana TaxID=7141 RepID=UPI003D15A467